MSDENGAFRGKVAFVTGAGTGIGSATALAFAHEGANVVVADVSQQGNQETARLIEHAGVQALAVACDVSRAEQVKAALEKTAETFGRLDFALNNAGVEQPIMPAADIKEEEWDRIFGIDLRGVFLCMKYEIPLMLKQGSGAIVNISSGPLNEAIRTHVFAAERIHADDTTVPVLAKGKTRTGRLWTYVRDDRPFGGRDPPATIFFYSADRGGEHPEQHLASYAGLMQADAYAGFKRLYDSRRKAGAIIEAACWAHARRKFFDIARINKAPIAIEAVKRIDALFAIEREINGLTPHERLAVRAERSRSLVLELEAWLREQRAKLSGQSETAKAIAYSLTRWAALTRFLDDGRLCMSNNAAEREVRAVAVGRKNWTFAGSDEGGRRAAAIYTLIATAKLNDIDPQAWLADVLARLPDHPARRIHDLLPWNWRPHRAAAEAA